MNLPNLKTILIISVSIISLLLITLAVQYSLFQDTSSELHECMMENEDLKEKNEELEAKLEECQNSNEKCRKLVMFLTARTIIDDDDLEDY